MARIRTIKPEFFTSEDIVELEPLARLLYIALWCEADKEGRFSWKPKTFKMRYLPADNCIIEDVCNALISSGLVVLYGDGLAYIPTFHRHQHINPRESVSSLPAPDYEQIKLSNYTDASARVTDASVTVNTRAGRKEGKEGNTRVNFIPPISSELLSDFIKVRKAKRAGDLTETAFKGIEREAAKAGITPEEAIRICCEKGWQGFNADWIKSELPVKRGVVL